MILSESERRQARLDIRELILASGQTAQWFRPREGNRLYAKDQAPLDALGSFPMEFKAMPASELGQKIDGTASVLPELAVRAEDHIEFDGIRYRIQTVQNQTFFGVITHQLLELVKLHGR